VILQADLEIGLGALLFDFEAIDVTLVFQQGCNGHLHFRGRHMYRTLFNPLRIANASEHVGDGIVHAHA